MELRKMVGKNYFPSTYSFLRVWEFWGWKLIITDFLEAAGDGHGGHDGGPRGPRSK